MEELDAQIYPRSEKGQSLVRAPLGVHRKSNRRYPFYDPETLKPVSMDVEGNLEYLTQVEKITNSKLAEELALQLREREKPQVSAPAGDVEYAEGREEIIRLKSEIGDLRSFIGQFVELNYKGRGSCPFHPPDEHPSFAVHETFWVCFHETNPETGRYLGGDVIDFWMRYRGVDFPTALEELEQVARER